MYFADVKCDQCGADYRIMLTSYYVGTVSEENCQRYWCSYCGLSASLPQVANKSEWAIWANAAENSARLKKYPFLKKLAGLVEEALSSRPWKIDVDHLDCPNCECPMTLGEELCTCVKCGKTGIKPITSIHAQLAGDDPPVV